MASLVGARRETERPAGAPGYHDGVTEPIDAEPIDAPKAGTDLQPPTEPLPPLEPAPAGEPAPATPGERRLAHPPSDRYREAEARAAAAAAGADRQDPGASLVRGLAIAIAAATVGAIATVVVGGVLSVTTGLVVVAGATGLGIALALQIGAGEHLTSRRRIVLAIALAGVAIALGQLGIWQYARSEGGVLSLGAYLGEVFGLLVPLQFGAGVVAAGLVAR